MWKEPPPPGASGRCPRLEDPLPALGPSAKRPRYRYVPYKILSYALFARLDCISRYAAGLDTHVAIRSGAFGRRLKVRRDSLRDHLRWLEESGYIRDLVFEFGRASFLVRSPNTHNWSADLPGDTNSQPSAGRSADAPETALE